MKKIVTLVAFTLLMYCNKSKAQFEITPFGGYVLQSEFNIDNGKARIEATPAYGLHITIPFKYSFGELEFTYERQDTKISAHGTDDTGMTFEDTIPVGLNYFLFGGNIEAKHKQGGVIPFGGMQVGIAVIDGKEEYGNVVPFSFGFKGGLKYYISDRIGFRVQAQMNLMLILAGSNMVCAVGTSGSGCGFTVSAASSTGQIGFTGGIIFKLGKSKKDDKPKKEFL